MKDKQKRDEIKIIFSDEVEDNDTIKNYTYPIFNECIKCTSDNFWIEILQDLSMGKCPKGLYILNNNIYCIGKKNSFSLSIPKAVDDYSKFFTEFKSKLSTNTNICSDVDNTLKNKALRENTDDVTNKSVWSDVKKKNVQAMYITEFVLRMKKKYSLSWNNARELLSIVQNAFIYKTHSSKSIVFKNKKIDSINDIVYDSDRKKFVNSRLIDSTQYDLEDTTKKKFLCYYWPKYLSSVCKGIV